MQNKYYIYLVHNQVNSKIYVGRTMYPKYRWSSHIKEALQGSNTIFHKAIRKYGISSFIFEIFAEVKKLEEVNALETLMIHIFRTYDRNYGYNMNFGNGASIEVSEETRKKISAIHKGRIVSDKTRKKLSAVQRGKPGRVWTQEQKEAVTERQLGKPIHTNESKKKIGEKNSKKLKGRKLSSETRLKMSISFRRLKTRAKRGVCYCCFHPFTMDPSSLNVYCSAKCSAKIREIFRKRKREENETRSLLRRIGDGSNQSVLRQSF